MKKPIEKLRKLVQISREKYNIQTEFSYRFDSRSKKLILCYAIPLVVHRAGGSKTQMKKKEKYFGDINDQNYQKYFKGSSRIVRQHADFVQGEKDKYDERYGNNDEYDFRFWVDKFLSREYGRARHSSKLSPHTIKSNKNHLPPFRDYCLMINPSAGEILNHSDNAWKWFEQYFQDRLEGKYKGKWSPTTVGTAYRNICGFYNFVADRHPDNFPYGVLKKVQIPKGNSKRDNINEYEYEEIIKFITDKMNDTYWGKFILLLRLQLKTGMREGELVSIKIKNIDKKVKAIWVVGKSGRRPYYFNQKHDKKIWTDIINAIKPKAEYLFYQTRVQKFPSQKNKDGSIVKKLIDRDLSAHTTESYYNQRFREMRDEELKIRGKGIITSHSLRRYFITTYVEQSGDIERTRQLVGHTSARMTEKYMSSIIKKDTKTTIDIGV